MCCVFNGLCLCVNLLHEAHEQMCVCVSSLEHRDGDRQVSERASERHHFLIKITSGLIRVGAVIAWTCCLVPAGLPWIRLSLPLPWQCMITSNHRKHFLFFWYLSVDSPDRNKRWWDGAVFSLGYVSVSFSLEGELMGELRAGSGLDSVLLNSGASVTPMCHY